ncbi:MAG: hypothetical protein ABSH21_02670 [Verrucomicrobiia bacterium]|jgi:hypothetical protein
MPKTKRNSTREDPALKELQRIRNLLMLCLIKLGADSKELDLAVGMGSSNIRAMLPIKQIEKILKD